MKNYTRKKKILCIRSIRTLHTFFKVRNFISNDPFIFLLITFWIEGHQNFENLNTHTQTHNNKNHNKFLYEWPRSERVQRNLPLPKLTETLGPGERRQHGVENGAAQGGRRLHVPSSFMSICANNIPSCGLGGLVRGTIEDFMEPKREKPSCL